MIVKSAGISKVLGKVDAKVNKTGYKLKDDNKQIVKIQQGQPISKNENKNEHIEDVYINQFDASVFVNYRKKDGDVRMISKGEWNSAQDLLGEEKVNYLKEKSKLVTVNNSQIQEMMQEIHKRTVNTEHQIYIYLDREAAEIKAVIGKEGVDGETVIDYYTTGDSKPIIHEGEVRGALLGQVHTHNLKKSISNSSMGSSTTIGRSKEINDFGTSEIDKMTAKSLDIIIYALDSWNYASKNAEVSIGKVTPQGISTKNIGKTHGKGDGKKIVNIGLECLNYRIGR